MLGLGMEMRVNQEVEIMMAMHSAVLEQRTDTSVLPVCVVCMYGFVC